MRQAISEKTRHFVANRAKFRCEYCQIHSDDMFLSFEIDHVIPIKHRGNSNAVNLALDDLEKMRENEGLMLKNELSFRLDEIAKLLPTIENEADNVTEEYRQRLNKRISELLAKSDSQIEIDQARLANEVAFLADRCDISEEIQRLKSHIEQFRQIINEEKEVGKRLDFLTQEFNREANTIASKTNNLVIKENALTIKSEIEKIREQVQNVE
mgnify:CR=1 FL=1